MKQRPVADVIVSSNHNESSPDTVGIYGGPENPAVPVGDRTGIDEYYMHKWLIPQAVAAGVKAYDDLQPATLWARQTLAPPDITVRTHTFPTEDDKGNPVAIDPKYRVLQARDSNGKAIFTMLNLAAHNQQYGHNGDHNTISGDWPGAFVRRPGRADPRECAARGPRPPVHRQSGRGVPGADGGKPVGHRRRRVPEPS